MVCKEITEILGDYMDGTLDEEAKAELEEHFQDCPPCVAFFNTYKKSCHLTKEALKETSIPDAVLDRTRYYLMGKKEKIISHQEK